jgi:hypothetical protein
VIESKEVMIGFNSTVLPQFSKVIIILNSLGFAPSRIFGNNGPRILGRPSWVIPTVKASSLGLSGEPLNHLVNTKRTSLKYASVPLDPLVPHILSTLLKRSLESWSITA